MNIGLEESYADFAERLFHVFGAKFSFATQVLEDPLQLVGQILEHDWVSEVSQGTSVSTLLLGQETD